jgi:uncharacterized protein (TIGR02996 family)
MANDERPLLRAILAAPEDDTPRLILADWLDEHSLAERAEFIRVQCELAVVRPRQCDCKGMSDPEDVGPNCVLRARLEARERELWDGVRENDIRPTLTERFPGEWCIVHDRSGSIVEDATAAVVRRGFVAEVRCDLATLFGGPCGRCGGEGLTYTGPGGGQRAQERCTACNGERTTPGIAAALFASQPVSAVTLTDREPAQVGNEWVWFRDAYTRHGVPDELWEHFGQDYQFGRVRRLHATTPDAALSSAAVALGRSAAGLPPLTPAHPSPGS